jgi:RNA polymerase sigma-70 factor (ECF subfamily)
LVTPLRGIADATPESEGEEGWDWESARRLCLRVASRHAGSAAEAEDIAQDALVRAWRFRGSLREGERAGGWLARITVNEARRRRPRLDDQSLDELATDVGADDERICSAPERATVTAAIAELGERDRTLLKLRYEDDLTHAVIASRLGMQVGTVKVRLHRARGKLHRALEGS